ncbi:hypothetical protein [Komagataeibacter medellinensis]|uniref:hypothetical protein n=1 Tax=Komagataeibacter medellinensis TaxID=1177712 RepID=UPI0003A3C8D5|nr:hypothetical protein [Komagataeibacter medellinensis]
MSLFVLSPLIRMMRGFLLRVMNSDFIRTVRAMGLPIWCIYDQVGDILHGTIVEEGEYERIFQNP